MVEYPFDHKIINVCLQTQDCDSVDGDEQPES